MNKVYLTGSLLAILLLFNCAGIEEPVISHGPILGAVSGNSVAFWVRTSIPGKVVFNEYVV